MASRLMQVEGVIQRGHQPAPFLNAIGNAMSKPGWTADDGLAAMLDPKVANKWSSAWQALTDLRERLT